LAKLAPLARLPATNQLRLALGVPLRDQAGLDHFIVDVSNPTSPNYRRYLTAQELADRFGPTEQDYEAVKEFARTNGLTVTSTYNNRLVLDVAGPAAAVEKALHVTLHTYQHPTEQRTFFAPDTEPTVAAELPLVDIQGLSDFSRPHPHFKRQEAANIIAHGGTSPDGSGSYFGNDFRNAYAPGVTLTGAGQIVGLLQFHGFYSKDIAAYAAAAGGGRSSIPIQTVLLDGFNGTPTRGLGSGDTEVSLDIEMAMSMAPGLSKIMVFEAGPYGSPNDVLNSMLTYSNSVKQLSSSWGWSGGPSTTTDNIFKYMIGAGQSFFNASGDSDAFTSGASSSNGVDNPNLDNAPSSCPYITQVGGTTLTMSGSGGAYASEVVWNWGLDAGSYVGSSGGISSSYPLPSWQASVSNLPGRGGSASLRNTPDVALTADNVYVVSGGHAAGSGGIGGTSCAAPLWAGFMALVNQQAAANGKPSAGFINPAIYSLAAGSSYSACFHDVVSGNNFSSASPNLFYATNGYDLCTGLGTPNGPGLISALAGAADSLVITAPAGTTFSGPADGPFSPASSLFQLTNASSAALGWSLINTSAWLTVDVTSGTLAAHATATVNVSASAAAASLAVGNYSTFIEFTNATSHAVQKFSVALQVYQPLAVSPATGFSAVGPVGGPFAGGTQSYVLTNLSNGTVNWTLTDTSVWLSASATGGSLAPGSAMVISASVLPSANKLPAGVYISSLVLNSGAGLVAAIPFSITVGQPAIQNGGFELGNFTDWIQSGNVAYTFVTNSASSALYVHSGTYAAILGPSGSPGYLTQNLATLPGVSYVISLWLRNPSGLTPNQFSVQWNGTTIFSESNVTGTGWSNLVFFATATNTITPLQLGFQNDPDYFGLDDITVTPMATPAFNAAVSSAGSFRLDFGTTPGLIYQVQYTTNLTQGIWMNLGGPVTAGANTLSIYDPAAGSSSQRYYRLAVSP
jgi:subtilase family serine protease